MKRRIHIFLLFAVAVLGLSGCGRQDKVSDKAFEDALDAYQEYADDVLKRDYEEYGAIITLDSTGLPMMFAYGIYDLDRADLADIMFLSCKKGKVVSLKEVHDVTADYGFPVTIYSDGIVLITDEEEQRKEWYQIGKGKIEEVAYYEWEELPTEIWLDESYPGEEDTEDGELEEFKRTINFFPGKKEIEVSLYVEDPKECEKQYKKICKQLYAGDAYASDYDKMVWLNMICEEDDDNEAFMQSPAIVVDDESVLLPKDLRYQISKLKEAGSMTNEEFLVWQHNFSTKLSDIYFFPSASCLIYKNPLLLNEVDRFYDWETDVEGYGGLVQMTLLDYIVKTGNVALADDIKVFENLSDEEFETISKRYVNSVLWQELYEISDPAIRSYGEKKITSLLEKGITTGKRHNQLKDIRKLITDIPEEIENWEENFYEPMNITGYDVIRDDFSVESGGEKFIMFFDRVVFEGKNDVAIDSLNLAIEEAENAYKEEYHIGDQEWWEEQIQDHKEFLGGNFEFSYEPYTLESVYYDEDYVSVAYSWYWCGGGVGNQGYLGLNYSQKDRSTLYLDQLLDADTASINQMILETLDEIQQQNIGFYESALEKYNAGADYNFSFDEDNVYVYFEPYEVQQGGWGVTHTIMRNETSRKKQQESRKKQKQQKQESRKKTQDLETSEAIVSEPAASAQDINVEEEVAQIRNWFTETQSNLENYLRAGYVDMSCYFDGMYPVKVIVDKGYDDWDYTREYYYHDQNLYFVFVYNGSEEYRLYLNNGKLIRFIDSEKEIYDYGNTDQFEEWREYLLNESDTIYPTMINCGS